MARLGGLLFLIILMKATACWQALEPPAHYFSAVQDEVALFAEVGVVDSLLAIPFLNTELKRRCLQWATQSTHGLKQWMDTSTHLLVPYLHSPNESGLILVFQALPVGWKLEQQPIEATQKTSWQGAELYHYPAKDLVICQFKDLLLCSNLAGAIEDMLTQLQGPSRQGRLFSHLANTTAEYPVRLFVNSEKLKNGLAPFARPQAAHWQFPNILPPGWTCLGLQTTRVGFAIEGASERKPQANRQPIDPLAVAKVIPDMVDVVNCLNSNDLESLWQVDEQSLGFAEEQFIRPWMGPQLAMVQLHSIGGSVGKGGALVLSIEDSVVAERQLAQFGKERGLLDSATYQAYVIHQINAPGFWRSPLVGELHNPYYTIIDQHVIFCHSKQALINWLDHYLIGRTMANDVDFLKFVKDRQENLYVLYFSRPKQLVESFRTVLADSLFVRLESQFAFLNADVFSIAMGTHSGQPSLGGFMGRSAISVPGGQPLWKTSLRAPAICAPILLSSHASSRFEIAIQDANYLLYFLDDKGSITRTQQLGGPMISDIYQLKKPDDGVECLLFNSRTKVYLTDREGKSLQHYPFAFQAKATTGLCLVDYGGRREYEYYLPVGEGLIYGYSFSGAPLNGWTPQRAAGLICQPLQHFEKGGKDFLIALNTSGMLTAYSRFGKKRFSVATKSDTILSAPFVESSSDRCRIVVSRGDGKLEVVKPDGQHFGLATAVGKNEKVRFLMADLRGDKTKEYAVTSGKALAIYAYQGSAFRVVERIQLEAVVDSLFVVDLPGAQKQSIGLLNRTEKTVWLMDGNGKVHPGFPLAGTTAFDFAPLARGQAPVMLVAKEDLLYAYRLKKNGL